MTQGTDNSEIQYLMIKAEWMMNGGKSEEDWEALPISTIKLLTVDHFAKEERQVDLLAAGIAKAFGADKKKGGY